MDDQYAAIKRSLHTVGNQHRFSVFEGCREVYMSTVFAFAFNRCDVLAASIKPLPTIHVDAAECRARVTLYESLRLPNTPEYMAPLDFKSMMASMGTLVPASLSGELFHFSCELYSIACSVELAVLLMMYVCRNIPVDLSSPNNNVTHASALERALLLNHVDILQRRQTQILAPIRHVSRGMIEDDGTLSWYGLNTIVARHLSCVNALWGTASITCDRSTAAWIVSALWADQLAQSGVPKFARPTAYMRYSSSAIFDALREWCLLHPNENKSMFLRLAQFADIIVKDIKAAVENHDNVSELTRINQRRAVEIAAATNYRVLPFDNVSSQTTTNMFPSCFNKMELARGAVTITRIITDLDYFFGPFLKTYVDTYADECDAQFYIEIARAKRMMEMYNAAAHRHGPTTEWIVLCMKWSECHGDNSTAAAAATATTEFERKNATMRVMRAHISRLIEYYEPFTTPIMSHKCCAIIGNCLLLPAPAHRIMSIVGLYINERFIIQSSRGTKTVDIAPILMRAIINSSHIAISTYVSARVLLYALQTMMVWLQQRRTFVPTHDAIERNGGLGWYVRSFFFFMDVIERAPMPECYVKKGTNAAVRTLLLPFHPSARIVASKDMLAVIRTIIERVKMISRDVNDVWPKYSFMQGVINTLLARVPEHQSYLSNKCLIYSNAASMARLNECVARGLPIEENMVIRHKEVYKTRPSSSTSSNDTLEKRERNDDDDLGDLGDLGDPGDDGDGDNPREPKKPKTKRVPQSRSTSKPYTPQEANRISSVFYSLIELCVNPRIPVSVAWDTFTSIANADTNEDPTVFIPSHHYQKNYYRSYNEHITETTKAVASGKLPALPPQSTNPAILPDASSQRKHICMYNFLVANERHTLSTAKLATLGVPPAPVDPIVLLWNTELPLPFHYNGTEWWRFGLSFPMFRYYADPLANIELNQHDVVRGIVGPSLSQLVACAPTINFDGQTCVQIMEDVLRMM